MTTTEITIIGVITLICSLVIALNNFFGLKDRFFRTKERTESGLPPIAESKSDDYPFFQSNQLDDLILKRAYEFEIEQNRPYIEAEEMHGQLAIENLERSEFDEALLALDANNLIEALGRDGVGNIYSFCVSGAGYIAYMKRHNKDVENEITRVAQHLKGIRRTVAKHVADQVQLPWPTVVHIIEWLHKKKLVKAVRNGAGGYIIDPNQALLRRFLQQPLKIR